MILFNVCIPYNVVLFFSACQNPENRCWGILDSSNIKVVWVLGSQYGSQPTFRVWLNRCWCILGQDQGCLRSGCRSALSSRRPFATWCLKCYRNVLNNIIVLKHLLPNQYTHQFQLLKSKSIFLKYNCSKQRLWSWMKSRKAKDKIVQKTMPPQLNK